MRKVGRCLIVVLLLAGLAVFGGVAQAAYFADQVVSYAAGADAYLTDPDAALGKPGYMVGAGTGGDEVYNPFSPHYEGHEIAQIGNGGHITLHLERPAYAKPGIAEIGVFTNVGLTDKDWQNPIGETLPDGTDPGHFWAPGFFSTYEGMFGDDSAHVEVSQDGVAFVPISADAIYFNLPGNYYANLPARGTTPGTVEADFGKEFTGTIYDFIGLPNLATVLGVLDGSAGGTWLDIDGTGLDSVSYIRFSVDVAGDTFELCAVSVNDQAVAEPGALSLLAIGGLGLLRRRRR